MMAWILSFGLSIALAGDGDVELSDTVSGKKAPKLKVDDIVLSTQEVFEDNSHQWKLNS